MRGWLGASCILDPCLPARLTRLPARLGSEAPFGPAAGGPAARGGARPAIARRWRRSGSCWSWLTLCEYSLISFHLRQAPLHSVPGADHPVPWRRNDRWTRQPTERCCVWGPSVGSTAVPRCCVGPLPAAPLCSVLLGAAPAYCRTQLQTKDVPVGPRPQDYMHTITAGAPGGGR